MKAVLIFRPPSVVTLALREPVGSKPVPSRRYRAGMSQMADLLERDRAFRFTVGQAAYRLGLTPRDTSV